MTRALPSEVLEGLWRLEALHPEWTESEGGEDGWAQNVGTCHWLQRSIVEAVAHYSSDVWAKPPPAGTPLHPFDHPATGGRELVGDAMLRSATGELRTGPDSWVAHDGDPARLRAVIGSLLEWPGEHVLVSHGRLILGRGRESLQAGIR